MAETEQRLSWPLEDRRSFANDRLGEFLPSALSWSALGRPTRGQDHKEWLRTVHKAPVHVEHIRAAAAKIDDLKDLPAILHAMK